MPDPIDPQQLLRDLAILMRRYMRIVERLTGAAPSEPCGAAPGATHGSPEELSELDAAILAQLRRQSPLKGATVARRLGRNYSYVRKRLAHLVAVGMIRRGERGYEVIP